MSSIISSTSTPPVGVPSTTGPGSTAPTGTTTGTGTVGQTGTVPDVKSDPLYSVMMQSLNKLMPEMSSEDVSALIAEVVEQLKNTQQTNANEKYRLDANEKQAALAQVKEQLEEAVKKLKDAEAARGSGNIFALIKLAFQMLGAILMAALGAILTPFSGGAGALLIAGAVLTALAAIDGAVKMGTGGTGIVGSIVKAAGGEEAAKYADMAFGAALAVATLVVGIASVKGSMDAIKDLTMAVLKMTADLMAIAGALSDVGSSAAGMASASKMADAKNTQADQKDLEALTALLDAAIDQAIARMMAAGDRFNEVLDSLVEAMNDRANTFTRARFSA